MIVFFSDHGGPFPRYKRDLSDAGLHVPFIVKWPKGVSHPKRNSGLFSFIDLSVTILHWLGVSKNTSFSQQVILPFGEGHMAVFVRQIEWMSKKVEDEVSELQNGD